MGLKKKRIEGYNEGGSDKGITTLPSQDVYRSRGAGELHDFDKTVSPKKLVGMDEKTLATNRMNYGKTPPKSPPKAPPLKKKK